MARNFVQDGDTLTLVAPYDRLSGQGALVGVLFGVSLNDVASGAESEFGLEGVWDLDKVSAQAWTQGQKIYWDDTAKLATTVSTSNKLIGAAVLTAANPSDVGRVLLNEAVA